MMWYFAVASVIEGQSCRINELNELADLIGLCLAAQWLHVHALAQLWMIPDPVAACLAIEQEAEGCEQALEIAEPDVPIAVEDRLLDACRILGEMACRASPPVKQRGYRLPPLSLLRQNES